MKVTTFEEEFGLTATAINSTHGGCTSEIMAVRTEANGVQEKVTHIDKGHIQRKMANGYDLSRAHTVKKICQKCVAKL